MSSVRRFFTFCDPNAAPRNGIFESSGMPALDEVLSSRISPPRTMDSPEATTTVVVVVRWLMSGLAPGTEVGRGTLTSWLISSVTWPPELMRGVTDSRIPVSMYWKLLMTPTAAPGTVCCCV